MVVVSQIIGQYRPTFLGLCENAIKWSNDFVEQQLTDGMFADLPDRKKKAKRVTKALSNYPKNRSHERHFDADDCEKMGLHIQHLEADPVMQDLVLIVHHCYMNLLSNTASFKIIENHNGIAMAKVTQAAAPLPNPKQLAESLG
jgi:hypothetical protein